jgi:membrane protein
MIAYFATTLGWTELAKRTYREMMDDDALGLAAQLAYYFFLALFPAILCLLALASYLPLENFTDDVIAGAARFAPDEMLALVQQQMVRLADRDSGGLATIGFLGALWSSSAALVAVISAMNRAYDIEEGRPWWKVRMTAILLTMGLALFIVLSFALIVLGPQLADLVAAQFGLGAAFAWTWKIVQWPIAFALVVTAISLVYYFAPDAEQEFAWITPGSLVATVIWLLGSLGFRFYVVNFGSYEATYGAVAGVILLLLWFYMSGLVIILGAELSSVIEHASPWGKNPGEKVPGEKKKIGAAAGRAFGRRSQPASDAARQKPAESVPDPGAAVPHPVPAFTTPSWSSRIAGALIYLVHPRRRNTKS